MPTDGQRAVASLPRLRRLQVPGAARLLVLRRPGFYASFRVRAAVVAVDASRGKVGAAPIDPGGSRSRARVVLGTGLAARGGPRSQSVADPVASAARWRPSSWREAPRAAGSPAAGRRARPVDTSPGRTPRPSCPRWPDRSRRYRSRRGGRRRPGRPGLDRSSPPTCGTATPDRGRRPATRAARSSRPRTCPPGPRRRDRPVPRGRPRRPRPGAAATSGASPRAGDLEAVTARLGGVAGHQRELPRRSAGRPGHRRRHHRWGDGRELGGRPPVRVRGQARGTGDRGREGVSSTVRVAEAQPDGAGGQRHGWALDAEAQRLVQCRRGARVRPTAARSAAMSSHDSASWSCSAAIGNASAADWPCRHADIASARKRRASGGTLRRWFTRPRPPPRASPRSPRRRRPAPARPAGRSTPPRRSWPASRARTP